MECREDVTQVLEDMSYSGVIHGDLRMPNVILAPANTKKCTHHDRVHKWNIIDFGLSYIVDFDLERHNLHAALSVVDESDYRQPYFLGYWVD